jgi:Concanavalin A-like lectin/glucanases superfamily
MTEWAWVLTPILVLPIVLLFRFVGCAQIAGLESPGSPTEPAPAPPAEPATPPPVPPPSIPTPPAETKPPNYRKYILGEQPNPGLVNTFPAVVPNGADVIAYWRLVDAATATLADDEKDFQDGTYRSGHALPAAPASEARDPAKFVTGQASLIDSDPLVQGRFFDGGYVLVTYKPGLHSEQFTLEAWVRVNVLAPGFEHTLFDAGGTYASPAGTPAVPRGFRIFADQTGHWQVRMGNPPANLFAAPPAVPLGAHTHVAVTLAGPAGGTATVSLYVAGKLFGAVTFPAYAPPYDAPLFIGLENTANTPTGTPTLRTPFLGWIQEVVLHRKALSAEEIANHVDINRPA